MPLMVDAELSIGTPEALWLDFDGAAPPVRAHNSSSIWLASCSPLLGGERNGYFEEVDQ